MFSTFLRVNFLGVPFQVALSVLSFYFRKRNKKDATSIANARIFAN